MTGLRVHLRVLGKVRVHPLFVLLVLLSCGVGLWKEVLVLFLLVMLHELGHAAAANALGYEVEQVSLLPFGGVARLAYGTLGFVPMHEAVIAIAGPLVNVLLSLLAWALSAVGIWSDAFFSTMLQLNLSIIAFNLLPALPLDGGRVLRAARSRKIGYENATREAYNVAIVLALFLLCVGGLSLWAGFPHIGMLILAVFLFMTAWTGRRDLSMDTVRFLDAKRMKPKTTSEVVRALATPANASIRDVVRQFAPDRYHMVYVRDASGQVQTVLEEEELLDAVFEGNWLDPIGKWIQRP